MSVDEKLDQQLDEILNALSYAQWELGNKGLIPLSKNINKAKQAIKDLIATEVLHARIEELSNLKAEKGRFSTSSYGLWVDGAIDNRIVELEAQLNKSFSYQITKSNKEIKTQLEDKS